MERSNVMEAKFELRPIPKPRMTVRDKWAHRPIVDRYFMFKDALHLLANKQKFVLPDEYEIVFYLEMPKSWGKKKKVEYLGKPHQAKPDLDNLVKAFQDALVCEDMRVYKTLSEKYWSDNDLIVVRWQ